MTGADCVEVAAKSQPLSNFGISGDKNISDLIEDDVSIEWDDTTGKVKGKIKKLEAWAEFDSTNNDGHFFPIVLNEQYDKKLITVEGSNTKTVADRFWVLRVENAKGGAKGTFTFKQGETLLFTLNFSEATLNDS